MKGFLKLIVALQVLAIMGMSAGNLSAQNLRSRSGQDTDRSVALSNEKYNGRGYYATPWMAGVKVNMLPFLISVPYAGVEVQLADKLSLDLSGWYGKWNVFHYNDQTNLYGGAPEIRWWLGDQPMRKGHFVGLHGMAAWYTLEWRTKDGNTVIYQNGSADQNDSGSLNPAWSCGFTYGYSLPLDKKGRLGFEFYVGLGYYSYQQKSIETLPNGRFNYQHQVRDGIGITKIGANLAYRFSLRRYKER